MGQRPDSFEQLLKKKTSRRGDQATRDASQGLIGLLLLAIIIAIIFPAFWLVFLILLIFALIYWGREWMG